MTTRSSFLEKQMSKINKHGTHEIFFESMDYVCDVYGNSVFGVIGYYINPGMQESFMSIAGVASSFEMYKFLELEYYYKPLNVNLLSGTNLSMGFVGIAGSYTSSLVGVNEFNYATNYINTKQQFLSLDNAVSVVPSEPMKFCFDCKRSTKENYYVRIGGNVTDLRLSDMGVIYIATGGQQSTNMLGELYVKYKVRLIKSKLNYSLGNANKYAHYYCSSYPAGSNLTTSTWFGATQTSQVGSTMSLQFLVIPGITTTSVFYLPINLVNCNFCVIISVIGGNGTWSFGNPVLYNCTQNNLFSGGFDGHSGFSGSGGQMILTYFLTPTLADNNDVVNNAVGFGLTNAGTILTTSTLDIFVFQMPANALS